VWIRRKVRGAKQAFQFIQQPDHFLITTLIGNNIAVVATSSLMVLYLGRVLSGFALTVVSSLILLFWGEILPKTIARDEATTFAIRTSSVLRGFYYLFYPVVWVVRKTLNVLIQSIGLQKKQVERLFSRKEMERLVREGEKVGLVDEEHSRMISRFILRGNQKVREAMIPRTEIVVVNKNQPVEEVVHVFRISGFSRLPVIGQDIDEILGVINARDVIIEQPDTIDQIIREVHFIPETKRALSLLREMREKRIGMAIVIDEYGGTAGLLTIEDIVEEFFGNIQDEFDDEISLYRNIGKKQIDVNARIEINELNSRFQLRLPLGDYQTLGGLILDRTGHIPERGEQIEMETCTLQVLLASKKMVKWVSIIRKNVEEIYSS
jgi:CBS domain containing-hemolysin-like protein